MFVDTIKWTSVGAIATSAIAISLFPTLTSESITFVGFLVGHIGWAYTAMRTRVTPDLVLNLVFIPIDIYAMVVRTAT